MAGHLYSLSKRSSVLNFTARGHDVIYPRGTSFFSRTWRSPIQVLTGGKSASPRCLDTYDARATLRVHRQNLTRALLSLGELGLPVTPVGPLTRALPHSHYLPLCTRSLRVGWPGPEGWLMEELARQHTKVRSNCHLQSRVRCLFLRQAPFVPSLTSPATIFTPRSAARWRPRLH